MKLVTLLGAGCGPRQGLTAQAQERLERAELVLGAQRLLDALPVLTAERVPAVRSGDLLARIQDGGEARICVVFSGDAGFHSGARTLIPLLEEQGINYEVLPGISSVQALSARLGRPWEDWRLCSAHGAKCDPVFEVCQGKPAFFLTGGSDGPAEICRALTECGLGELEAVVGENLGYAEETL
ncbi:MAG: precorrin-6y C5,15-methyltransferase (decarboxylating) subunit CbiE, partial [Oscillospiraceae bacterium]|nr:precorrin-6y C5,15-methyltransferase (decarboxylating) subunit CbiE [Oscillospiraceae bacterium]